MRNEGFLTFTSVGIIIILITASFVAYYEWNRHQNAVGSIRTDSSFHLSTAVASKRNNLEKKARKSLYESLWHICKEDYDNLKNQEESIEKLASSNLHKRLKLLEREKNFPFHSKINLGEGTVKTEIEPGRDNYVLASISLPDNTSISALSTDNSVSIVLPCERIQTVTDVRYFLLENRMKKFENEFNKIQRRWKYAEYATAYKQAWLDESINFNKDRTKALFEISLSSHEIGKFGSTDYQNLAQNFLKYFMKLDEFKQQAPNNPARKKIIGKLKRKTNSSISRVQEATRELKTVEKDIQRIKQFNLTTKLNKKSEKMSQLIREIENHDSNDLKEKFRHICREYEETCSFPLEKYERSLDKLEKLDKILSEAKKDINFGLETLKSAADKDRVLLQLYKNLTRNNKSDGVFIQFERGLKDVKKDINSLKQAIKKIKSDLVKLNLKDNKFMLKFGKKSYLSKIGDNKKYLENIIRKALISAEKSTEMIEKEFQKNKNHLDEILEKISRQKKIPNTFQEKKYKKYPDPGEDPKKKPKEKTAEKFTIPENKGTLAGLEKILKLSSSHLEKIKDLTSKIDKKQKYLDNFDINKKLRNKIKENPKPNPNNKLSREKFYEAFPPKPLFENPGISVYHEVIIDNVEYNREDPLGLVHKSAPPTPIYLWFIDTVVYWGMWNVKIELQKPIVEEIFDYKNQTIPRPLIKGTEVYIHKPLPYREKFQKNEFNFRLLVFSLRNFTVSYN